MGGDSEPPTVPARPHVGVAPRTGAAVCRRVGRASVDDRDVSHQPDVDVLGFEVRDGDRPCGLFQEGLPIDQGSVGQGAQEVVGQNLLEPLDVRGLDRADVVPVERVQNVSVRQGVDRAILGSDCPWRLPKK